MTREEFKERLGFLMNCELTVGQLSASDTLYSFMGNRDKFSTFLLKGYAGRVCTIDAREISIRNLGAYFPNTPMLAAVVEVSKCVDRDQFLKDMEESYKHKFAKKPQVIEPNLKCLSEAMNEIKG